MPKYKVKFFPIEIEIESENETEAEEKAVEQVHFGKATLEVEDIVELEELSCSKCGKIISENAFNKFGGMCGSCWADRN